MDPLTLALFGIGVGVSALSTLGGAAMTNSSQEKAHKEDLALAREQFDWGKKMDTFDMGMKMNAAKLETINNALKNNVALQDRFRTMFAPVK